MKKIFFVLSLFFLFVAFTPSIGKTFSAFAINETQETYSIYDENQKLVTTHNDVEFGDQIITSDLFVYTIINVDHNLKTAIARFVEKLRTPKVTLHKYTSPIDKNNSNNEKKIGLYMTHNAESYILGDGYDSVYGEGGVHDVAHKFKDELTKKGVKVVLDETLHLPHDSKAYSRSRITAREIWSQGVDAMFDLHRDAASRNTYLLNEDGVGKSKIRIVVGKSNSNSQQNLDFALTIFLVADILYPNLMLDIYFGRNEYNQTLTPYCLLFECGTYVLEKDYVLNSMPDLADLVYTAMYNTYIDSDTGDLMIGTASTPAIPDTDDEIIKPNPDDKDDQTDPNNGDNNNNNNQDNNEQNDDNDNDNDNDNENNDSVNEGNSNNATTEQNNKSSAGMIVLYVFCGMVFSFLVGGIVYKIFKKKKNN